MGLKVSLGLFEAGRLIYFLPLGWALSEVGANQALGACSNKYSS